MGKRILCAALCIVLFPFAFAASPTQKSAHTPPFSAVVLAGHSGPNYGLCPDGDQCTCDNGLNRWPSDDQSTSSQTSATSDPLQPDEPIDGGALMVLALTFYLWLRLRM